MYCHRCGNILTPESLFCNRCGSKVQNQSEPERPRPAHLATPPPRPPRRAPVIPSVPDEESSEESSEEYDDESFEEYEEDYREDSDDRERVIFAITPAFYEVA